jgi:hypothetical protein
VYTPLRNENRAKICRGQHCDCKKDVHFRRRLQYCFQEVEAALDDKVRIRADLKLAKQSLKDSKSPANRYMVKKALLEKRVSTASSNAGDALNSSRRQRQSVRSSGSSVGSRARPYDGVGEVSRRQSAQSAAAAGGSPPLTRTSSPQRSPGPRSPLRSAHSSPERRRESPGRDSYDSPGRRSMSSVYKGVLHSMEGQKVRSSHQHHSALEMGDISNWDLHHLQVQAPDLTQYQSLEF